MLYPRHIMQHAKLPKHKGVLPKYTHSTVQHNPLCGDSLSWQLSIDKQGIVTNAAWEGAGCVISQAAASILAETLVGNKIKTIQKINDQKFLQSLSITLSPTRQKCALLALKSLKDIKV